MKKILTVILSTILVFLNFSFVFAGTDNKNYDEYKPLPEYMKVKGIKYSLEGSDEIFVERNIKELDEYGYWQDLYTSKLYLAELPYGAIPKGVDIEVPPPNEVGIPSEVKSLVLHGNGDINSVIRLPLKEPLEDEIYLHGKDFIGEGETLKYKKMTEITLIREKNNGEISLLSLVKQHEAEIDMSEDTRGYLINGLVYGPKYDKYNHRWKKGILTHFNILVQTPVHRPEAETETASVSAKPGEMVTLPVSIKNNAGFAKLSAKPTYDTSVLEFAGYDLVGSLMGDAKVEGESISVSADTNKYMGDGQLFNVKFKVKEDAEEGSYEIGLQKECKTADGNAYEIKDKTGKIDISVPIEMVRDRSKKALKSYKNADEYRHAEQVKLAALIAEGEQKIEAASDKWNVQAALDEAKAEIDKLTTKEVYEAKENTKLTLEAEKELNKNNSVKYTDGLPTFVKQESKDLSFRLLEGDLQKFISIEVDGEAIDAASYNLSSGSIIATLKGDYLNSLGIGKHSIKVKTGEGYGETSFAVLTKTSANTSDNTSGKTGAKVTSDVAANKKSGKVNTGDNAAYALIFLGMASLALISAMVLRKRA